MPSKRIFSLVLCYLLALPSFGWWETGHRTIARIAAANLTPKARTRVARILGVADTAESVANAMVAASTWPDEYKRQLKTMAWHFTDLALQDSMKDIPRRCPNDNCLAARIEVFTRQLARHTQTGVNDRDALRYLVHFVGDVQQPLHSITDADLGGNCEHIDPFHEAKNLHALWDGGIVASLDMSDVELAGELNGYLDRIGSGQRKAWSKGDGTEWTWEAHELARRVVYDRLHIPVEPPLFPPNCNGAPQEIREFRPQIDSLYINDMKPVVRDQLAKGGLRLARVLNQSLK
jgi:hypothetical protein